MEMPSFLQSKQETASTDSKFKRFFKNRKNLSIVTLLILLLAIPLTVWLAQRAQIFSPRAAIAPIQLIMGQGSCVISTDPNKVTCPTFPIKLTSPFGPPATPLPSSMPSSSATSSATPASPSPSAQSSPSPSASVSASTVPSPSPSISPSPVVSPSPAASVDKIACMNNALGLNSPLQATGNKNNTTIVYWRSVVSLGALTEAANECGVSILNPTNFTGSVLDALVRGVQDGTTRSVLVEGPCTDVKVNEYRNNGIKVSADVQCDEPQLSYKVYATPNTFDGIGDFGGNGDPAIVIPATPGSGTSVGLNGGGIIFAVREFIGQLLTGEVLAQANTLSDGLISYWKLDEASGTMAADQKNTNNGTVTGTLIVNGKSGKALRFNGGESEKVSLGSSLSLNPTNLTVAAWINPYELSGWKTIAERRRVTNTGSWILDTYGALPNIWINTQAGWGACAGLGSPVPLNTWSLVTGTYDGSNAKIYLNGTLVRTCPIAGPMTNISSPTYIGFSEADTNQNFKGNIDEVLVYDRVLTDAEVASLAAGNLPVVNAASPSPAVSPSAGASVSPNPTASTTGSFAPSPTSSASGASPVIACIEAAFGFNNEFKTAVNSKVADSTLVYWNKTVNRQTFFDKVGQCGGQVLNPNNFTDNDLKNLVQSVTGAPANNTDNSKYRSVGLEGACTEAKIDEYKNAGHSLLTQDVNCNETGIDYKINNYLGQGSGANPFGIYSGIGDGGGSVYAAMVVSDSAAGVGTVSYRLAETEAGLANAQYKPYDQHPVLTDFTFVDATPGFKQIWVEFLAADGSTRKEHITVELVEPESIITSLDCSLDLPGKNLKVTLNGQRLGNNGGKVTVDGKEATVSSWNSEQVIADVAPEGNLDQGRLYKVILTKNDGEVLPEISCQVDTTLISLGAKLFCREPGKFDVNGVQITLVDQNGNRVNETVTIDKDGLIKTLNTKLQVGGLYAISIKAPYSLRRNALFTAAKGTNVVYTNDSTDFILPVGDIAPVISNDGKINTLDRSEIVRQWSVLGTSTKTGDFNRDTKVNSIDWACMRYDFNKEDEAIPARAVAPTPTPSASVNPSGAVVSPSPAGSTSANATPIASAGASAIPSPSAGQRAAYFLLNPDGTGTFANGAEFGVSINLWSQGEAANLFVAKVGFDPTALEVVRIEKGAVLTSWAEEYFDNQTGQMSLTAGLPSPGLKTTSSEDPLMAKIIFRAKQAGVTPIAINQGSRIYSNADNQDILNSLVSTQVTITN